ncbi:MAG: hypothetical protein ACQEWG_11800 [Bacteroidota bacterium]
MKKKMLIIILLLIIIYPIFSFVLLEQTLSDEPSLEAAQDQIYNFRLSIWISWIVFAVVSVYYKWTREENLFFNITYIFLLIAFSFFGYSIQNMSNIFDLPTRFDDNYSLGVFTAIQNFFAPAVLTIFLQLAVWWFTRKFHR